ncbi:MAG TPA: hypothetical protein VM598_01175 [Bdellovibrionota bacterium]|nr:hypothetical protein [Bdellovibrionota bacterium]
MPILLTVRMRVVNAVWAASAAAAAAAPSAIATISAILLLAALALLRMSLMMSAGPWPGYWRALGRCLRFL